jgi:hypothetical protein
MRGFATNFWLTLRLNFAKPQALIYGYVVPVFFLIAFAAVFRGGKPPLLHEMAQLVTISVLGGACFGLPTALVAERERGWWRRYRLLPHAAFPLLSSTLLARLILVAGAAVLQIVLARLLYGSPFPANLGDFALAYLFVAAAFLGMGLLVAALAQDVPAVQALGQCVFLPLIMIGGVGIPLATLPAWAQRVASFLPGRYSVEALDHGYSAAPAPFRFDLIALAAMAIAAGVAGARLFRWDAKHAVFARARRRREDGADAGASRGALLGTSWIAAALVPWLAVGLVSLRTGRWRIEKAAIDPAAEITPAQINSIPFENLPPDESVVTPIAPAGAQYSDEEKDRLDALTAQLTTWPPGHVPNDAQAIRNLVSVAAIADVAQDPDEGAIGRTVLNFLFAHFRQDKLEHGLAWLVLAPGDGTVPTHVPELNIPGEIDEREVRIRDAIYAQKFLGRVLGRINY